MSHIVNFATRTHNVSCTAIDNIFVDNTKLSKSSTSPIVNGLSDHDAQSLTINNTAVTTNITPSKQRTRKIIMNNHAVSASTKSGTWESVYRNNDRQQV
jgi:hypothetical protein